MSTRDGLWGYRDRHGDRFGRTYFRRFGDGVVSSIGLGTYRGAPTDAVDDAYRETLVAALESGCNVLDTAANYRCGRSERVVGAAVDRAAVDRSAVVVATKGGFLPFDGERPADPGEYVRERFVEPGVVDRADLALGQHTIAPEYVDRRVGESLDALGLDTLDLFYVHNPETQLEVRSREAVYDQLEAAFRRLERRKAAGDLRHYGVATWDAFRVPPDAESYLSLPAVVSRARAAARAAGEDTTGFRAIQLPFNAVMADAVTVAAHEGSDGRQSALHFAQAAGLDVFVSAPLAQGRLLDGLPGAVGDRVEGATAAQRAINFARSAPGVTAALVGTTAESHLREDLAAGEFDPLGAQAFDRVFE
jgi:aryl-alcohol dehydrogenase-like predicted oxidoreductase